jgi:sulfatase-like protein
MSERDTLPRTVLPIPDQHRTRLITYDAKDPDTTFPPTRQLRPPTGAPNVLIVLIDDAGFGAPSAFGGPCQTPRAERLAASGLKYIRFHTTGLCSPTCTARAADSSIVTTSSGSAISTWKSAEVLPSGTHQVRAEFEYAGGGLGKGGTVRLFVDGKTVGEGKVGATRGNEFNGRVRGVQLAITEGAEEVDHLVKPEEAIRIALSRQ